MLVFYEDIIGMILYDSNTQHSTTPCLLLAKDTQPIGFSSKPFLMRPLFPACALSLCMHPLSCMHPLLCDRSSSTSKAKPKQLDDDGNEHCV